MITDDDPAPVTPVTLLQLNYGKQLIVTVQLNALIKDVYAKTVHTIF